MFDFEVKIAQTQREIREALRLRYEIFKVEMTGSLKPPKAYELDTDIYDKFCDHLIVKDKIKNKTVGTYRLLLGSKVNRDLGFYSEKFFNIRNIKRLANHSQILELGRSCVHQDYRYGPVINLLWSGIAKYISDHNVRYLFGCPRLYTTEPEEVSKIFKFIKERFYAPLKFRVYPKPANKFKGLKINVPLPTTREIWNHLPPLVKGYLKVGVMVCGMPAFNPALDAVFIFALLDIQNIPAAYKQHFL